MISFLQKNFQFNYWANKQVLAALAEKPEVIEPDVWKNFSHIIHAEYLWLNRVMKNAAPKVDVWKIIAPDELEMRLDNAAQEWLLLMETFDDSHLQELCYFTNQNGESKELTIMDIIQHLCFHGAHHRGQLLAILGQKYGIHLSLDYHIFVENLQNNQDNLSDLFE